MSAQVYPVRNRTDLGWTSNDLESGLLGIELSNYNGHDESMMNIYPLQNIPSNPSGISETEMTQIETTATEPIKRSIFQRFVHAALLPWRRRQAATRQVYNIGETDISIIHDEIDGDDPHILLKDDLGNCKPYGYNVCFGPSYITQSEWINHLQYIDEGQLGNDSLLNDIFLYSKAQRLKKLQVEATEKLDENQIFVQIPDLSAKEEHLNCNRSATTEIQEDSFNDNESTIPNNNNNNNNPEANENNAEAEAADNRRTRLLTRPIKCCIYVDKSSIAITQREDREHEYRLSFRVSAEVPFKVKIQWNQREGEESCMSHCNEVSRDNLSSIVIEDTGRSVLCNIPIGESFMEKIIERNHGMLRIQGLSNHPIIAETSHKPDEKFQKREAWINSFIPSLFLNKNFGKAKEAIPKNTVPIEPYLTNVIPSQQEEKQQVYYEWPLVIHVSPVEPSKNSNSMVESIDSMMTYCSLVLHEAEASSKHDGISAETSISVTVHKQKLQLSDGWLLVVSDIYLGDAIEATNINAASPFSTLASEKFTSPKSDIALIPSSRSSDGLGPSMDSRLHTNGTAAGISRRLLNWQSFTTSLRKSLHRKVPSPVLSSLAPGKEDAENPALFSEQNHATWHEREKNQIDSITFPKQVYVEGNLYENDNQVPSNQNSCSENKGKSLSDPDTLTKSTLPSKTSPLTGGMVPTGSGNGDCVICMSDTPSVLLLPCRHWCLCLACSVQLLAKQNIDPTNQPTALPSWECPLCRKRICDAVHLILKKSK